MSFRLLSESSKVKIYKTVILPVVCMGEKISLTLGEEQKFRVFENRVLRRTFGPKMEEVAGGWRKLHNEELHNLYSTPDITRIIKLENEIGKYVARIGEIRNSYNILVGKPEGKRPPG
jgi:hypothetical protein